jgi:hypothetical protein
MLFLFFISSVSALSCSTPNSSLSFYIIAPPLSTVILHCYSTFPILTEFEPSVTTNTSVTLELLMPDNLGPNELIETTCSTLNETCLFAIVPSTSYRVRRLAVNTTSLRTTLNNSLLFKAISSVIREEMQASDFQFLIICVVYVFCLGCIELARWLVK